MSALEDALTIYETTGRGASRAVKLLKAEVKRQRVALEDIASDGCYGGTGNLNCHMLGRFVDPGERPCCPCRARAVLDDAEDKDNPKLTVSDVAGTFDGPDAIEWLREQRGEENG